MKKAKQKEQREKPPMVQCVKCGNYSGVCMAGFLSKTDGLRDCWHFRRKEAVDEKGD
jgi:hypothetical protein